MDISREENDFGHKGFEARYVARDVSPRLCWEILNEIRNGPSVDKAKKDQGSTEIFTPNIQNKTQIGAAA